MLRVLIKVYTIDHVATQNMLRIRLVTGSEGCTKDIEIVATSKFTTSSNASVDVDGYQGGRKDGSVTFHGGVSTV